MTADDIINRIKRKNNSDEQWLKIHSDILEFLRDNPLSPDRKYFVPLGYLEMVSMICDGILREKGDISPLTGFEVYKIQLKRLRKSLLD